MDKGDKTFEINPRLALGIILAQRLRDGYITWVTGWALELYKKDGMIISDFLQDIGFTDEMAISILKKWNNKP